jgi:predicted oxidoreductase
MSTTRVGFLKNQTPSTVDQEIANPFNNGPLFPTMLSLSAIVWGTWRLTQSDHTAQSLNRLINQCVELGITSFDHADLYGGYLAEARFGEALALSPGLREKTQQLSKCGIALVNPARPNHTVKHYNSSSDFITTSIETSLNNLQIEQLDLLMLHRPDYLMQAADTAEALSRAVAAGKLRAVGVSNFSPSQVSLLQSALPIPLAVNQIELSLSHRDALHNGVLDQCQAQSITAMAWSPLLLRPKSFRSGIAGVGVLEI